MASDVSAYVPREQYEAEIKKHRELIHKQVEIIAELLQLLIDAKIIQANDCKEFLN